MISDGLFMDMLMWKGFTDISWKLKIVFLILYPFMVIVLIFISLLKVIKLCTRFINLILRVIVRMTGR